MKPRDRNGPPSIGFGLERWGLLCWERPAVALILVIILSAISAVGLTRLEIDSDLRNAFRSSHPEFQLFERTARSFSASDRDVLVVVTGASLTTERGIAVLQTLHRELALSDGVLHVISLMSIRRQDKAGAPGRRLFPATLPSGQAFSKAMDEAARHPVAAGKLLSRNRRATLMVVHLSQVYPDIKDLRPVLTRLRKVAAQSTAGLDISASLTGLPVFRLDVAEAVFRDQLVFNFIGAVAGLLICFLVFRDWRLTIVALSPAVFAVLWTMGFMGLAGQKTNFLTNVVPILVMVIAFCDSMHLAFRLRSNMSAGAEIPSAARAAFREIGPACTLTTLTTAIAFLSLSAAESTYVVSFGLTAGVAVFAAYIAVLSLTPLLIRGLLSRRPVGAEEMSMPPLPAASQLLVRVNLLAVSAVGRNPATIVVVSSVILLVAGILFFQVSPRHRFGENLPDRREAAQAFAKINRDLGGATHILLLIEWPAATPARQVLAAIKDAHLAVSDVSTIKSVWSLYRFAPDLYARKDKSEVMVRRWLAGVPDAVRNRVLSQDFRKSLILAFVEDGSSAALNTQRAALEKKLLKLRRKHRDFSFAVTGFAATTARLSDRFIDELRTALAVATLLITGLMAVAFRSAKAALVSLPVNFFPLAIAGTALFVADEGLQFTTVVALTVGFGIAVDDTIHLLNVHRLRRVTGMPASRATDTLRQVGPVLIATTATLAAGLGMALLSDLPLVRLFGLIVVLVLVCALLADILYLPALIQLWERRFTLFKGRKN